MVHARLFACSLFSVILFVFCILFFFFLTGISHTVKCCETETKMIFWHYLRGRSVACIRSCNEHVHQIYYSMIPFAFMLVAYCMRYLYPYYILAQVTTNTHTCSHSFRIIHSNVFCFFFSSFSCRVHCATRSVCSYGNLDFYIIFLFVFFFCFNVFFFLFFSFVCLFVPPFIYVKVWTVQ